MGILRPATNSTAYLKAGILGFEGSGKSYTAALLAIGLSKLARAPEPGGHGPQRKPRVAFFDTETGSDYLIPKFRDAGVELLVVKSCSFADLLTFLEEAEDTCSVAIIDSVTPTWTELVEAHREKVRGGRLMFHHWGPIKKEWSRFTTAFVNSQLHVIVCGRAGFEYDYHKDAEGELELVKTGTKMRAEGQLAYEPSLLLEMEKVRREDGKGFIPQCIVLKDRADLLMGRVFEFPKFDDFLPVIEFLNIGATHVGVDASRNSADLVADPDVAGGMNQKLVAITLEEIKNVFIREDLAGQSKDAVRERLALLEKAFGVGSWTAIETLTLIDLWSGYRRLRLHFDPDADIPTHPGQYETPQGEPVPDDQSDADADPF